MPDQHVGAFTVGHRNGPLALVHRPFDDHPDQGLGATPPHFHIDGDQPERSEHRFDDPLDNGANPLGSSGGSRRDAAGWRYGMVLTSHDRKKSGQSPLST